ncbi:MAG: ParB/RepB/Spo0J family partition protein [Lachnospiraceae bacterium]|nr:ParB/RepB/Spo0J family partition protein [Lachnospiraceae bacterium]
MANVKTARKGKGGLGKGLDSLIPPKTAKEIPAVETTTSYAQELGKGGTETVVKLSKIEPNRNQPRKNFDEDALQELADSIKQYGLISPIIVQDRKDHYEIIAGERRWRASKLAGLKEVPVIIKNFTEEEIVEISLIENIQREDLNPIEEAMAYKRLMDEFHFKQDEVAEKVSKSRSAVTNAIRLLKLTDDVQQMLIDEKLTTGHVRALLAVEDPEEQYNLAQRAFDEKLSVREVEKLVKQLGKPQSKKKQKQKDESLEAIYRKREELLKSKLNTKVSVVSGENGAGKLEIDFYSAEDFDKICDLLMQK